MSGWRTDDPREFYNKRGLIIVNPIGAWVAFAHVETKNGWCVEFQRVRGFDFSDVWESDVWPIGWRWMPCP